MPTDNHSSDEQDAVRLAQVLPAHDSQLPHTQLAQAQMANVQLAQGASSIGSVASLSGQATITRATGETVQAEVGTPVFQDDTFETAAGGGVGLSFDDGSSFSLGPDARLTIDSYVYDAGGADSNMVMNLAQGAFSFVSGQVAKSGENNMSIVTPTATIGVRGTAGAGDDDEIVLLQEPGQQVGELTVTTQGGTVSLTTPNAYSNTSNPFAPPTPPTPRTLGDIQSLFGGALRQLPVQLPANQNLPSNDEGESGGEEGDPTGEGNADEAQEGEGEEGNAGEGEGGEGGEGEEGEGEEGEEGEGEEGEEGEGEEGEEGEVTGDAVPQDQGDDTLAQAPTPPPPIAPNVAPPKLAPPPPPPPKGPPPPPPDPVTSDDGGGEGGVIDNANVIPVNADATVTLTAGPDRIEVSGGEVTVTVNGTFEAGDNIVDVTNNNAQALEINDVTSHTFTVNGIEDVLFGNMTGSELHTITVAGTGTVVFNASSGPFDANISGDNANNTFNIGAAISNDSFVSANMGGGVDTVNINTSVQVNLLLGEVEFVSSTLGGSQNVVLGNEVSGVSFDFGALGDADVLTLFDGTNSIIVSDIQTVNGGTGNDTILVGSTALQTLSLGAGSDSVIATGVANFNVTALTSVENFLGSGGVDNVGLASSLTSGSVYDGGAGIDTLTLFTGSSNSASITNFRNIFGGASSEFLAFEAPLQASFNTIVDMGGGTFDELSLSDGGNDLTVANTETLTGGSGADILRLSDFAMEDVDLAGGTDEVVLNAGSGTINLFNFAGVETLTGTAGATEAVDLSGSGPVTGLSVDLGNQADNDSLTLSGSDDSVDVTDLHALSAGDGSDIISMNSGLISGDVYDGGNGNDTLNLASGSSNTATIVNFESILAGVGVTTESLTLENVISSTLLINLGGNVGNDSVQLADGGNVGIQVVGLKNFTGGGGDDQITVLGNLFTGSRYDGGGSGDDNDTLFLAGGSTNNTQLTDFEVVKVTGPTVGNVSITLEAGSQTSGQFDFSGGTGTNDTVTLADSNNAFDFISVENVTGGTGTDTITNSGSTGTTFILGDGGDVATGTAGASDIFRYVAQTDADVGEMEQITNFEDGVDLIDISSIVQGTFNFIGGGGANFSSSGNTEARFVDGSPGTLEIDVNGNGVVDMEIIMNGIASNQLDNTDFDVVVVST